MPAAFGNHDADEVLLNVGKRAAIVAVGPYRAACVHADPISDSGLRPYHLY
ncbi:MAG: hypothetical protein H0W07_04715 [Chloroflexi bacterium]|nr:hypothetical protein [Chloroflexota bacterium]